ncbi:neuroendocrine protein 7B2-like isoform X1 [Asterias amurensis]|uniref:neuroendocrine protein 7B2-like isoform X1 n=1 Tax=Asterias amurensis TaxID=7602 RepID=UPI003AB58FB7
MHLYFIAFIVASALYLVSGTYPISPSDRLALRSYLREALLGDMDEVMVGPATREESAANNKLIIPPNTFVSGGAGEGKQHLGASGKIPNKQVALPEVRPGYSTPPNPCPKTMDKDGRDIVKSEVHPRLVCYCMSGWEDTGSDEDCTESDNCCLAQMPNTADFVNQYQQAGEPKEQSYMPFKRNQFHDGEQRVQLVAKKSPEIIAKRSLGSRRLPTKRYNPYIDGQPYMEGVVAKKSPGLSGLPAM